MSREDFGLDNVQGVDANQVPGDDGEDDFQFTRTANPDYSRINGWEGNSLLDTEDLDGDNFLDEDNSYFSYVLDLSADSVGVGFVAQVNRDPNIPEYENNTWRLYRIPIEVGEAVGGVPRLKSIKYVRIWFDGIMPRDEGPEIRIASIKLVGTSWQERKLQAIDTGEPLPEGEIAGRFLMGVINNKESTNYISPFDPGTDANNEEEREQALVMRYDRIRSGFTSARVPDPPEFQASGEVGVQGSGYRAILDAGQGVSQDFTQYKTLSFYVRDGTYPADPGGMPPTDPSTGTFFFRFGPDTTNFYEFATKNYIDQSTSRRWREIEIDLQEISELKLDPPAGKRTVEGREVEYRFLVDGEDTLAVYGAPSLGTVRRLILGVKGDDPGRDSISGEIWVNDIRLRSVKDDVGYASRLSGNARFADFITLNGGVRKIDSEFRRIEGDRRGENEFSYNGTGDVKLNKFVDRLGISLPVSGDYSFSETVPRLAPNSDVELVDPQDKEEAKSTSTRWAVRTRFSKARPSRWWPLRYTIDNISLSGSHSEVDNKTPFQVSGEVTQSGQGTYNLNPGQGQDVPAAEVRLLVLSDAEARHERATLQAPVRRHPGGRPRGPGGGPARSGADPLAPGDPGIPVGSGAVQHV